MRKDKHIEIIARAIVVRDNKVLVCINKEEGHKFFPGGHVEFGESVEEALVREFKEETGAEITDIKFIDVVENRYIDKEQKRHEINLVYKAKIAEDKDTVSQELHIGFEWLDIEFFPKVDILPFELKKKVGEWLLE